ncbi:pilus assembly protein TadG-related protein [Pseudomonas sp. R5(2019)]|uniref:pilus assembly protein TadG-related protein n=1 Tax=Pseudomonas sp. R5(2019) TaxID=2697566 RepID=UPI0014122DE5|nr:pilus assembly protein TadG-related protein [Pseudomonas sp. R5(2019)]NBA95067.1 hypothetical protein [Pseudomonas sp. R5(2019)]
MPYRQRGAIGLTAALTLGMALLFAVTVIDSGRLYLEQRKLQRVADMAALEAVNGKGNCISPALSAQTLARAASARNGHAVDSDHTLVVECGSLKTTSGLRGFTADATKSDAVRAIAGAKVTTSIAAGVSALFSGANPSLTTQLTASAVAAQPGPPLARLNIRSTLVSIDTARSALLNSLMTALLGSQVNLSLMQWQGLLNADVNLLNYLDALAIKANVSAGNYTELLSKQIAVGDMLSVMSTVAQQNNPLVNVSGLADLSLLAQNAGGIVLGDLLNIQNGGTTSGLDANLQALQLVQGIVQLANSKHAAEVTLPVSLLGIANLTTRIRIIEPPQFSAIGNPAKATNNPSDADQIYVRTAQTRILMTLNIASISSGLNLLLVKVLPNGPNLDIGLEVASASSHVIGYNCNSVATKSLTVNDESAAVKVLIGKINSNNFFSSTTPSNATPLVILEVLGIDIGLVANSPVFGQTVEDTYTQPPELEAPSANHTQQSSNLVASVRSTLTGISLSPEVISLSLVTGLISGLLAPLLDPIINNLLTLLGIDLNQIQVGANLSCHTGRAQLMI